jgi:hypothetical protein
MKTTLVPIMLALLTLLITTSSRAYECSSDLTWECVDISSSGAAYWQSMARSFCEDHLDQRVPEMQDYEFGCVYGFDSPPYIYTAVTFTNMRCNFVEPGSRVGSCSQWMVDCSCGVAAKCKRPPWAPTPPLTVYPNDDMTPIVINLGNGGFRFTSADAGVHFDLNADGRPDRTAWTEGESENAFLALDRNGDGRVNDGSELFGNSTEQEPSSSPNGYKALAHFDTATGGGNGDGIVSALDSVWARLWIWRDENHNGVSEHEELSSPTTAGIASIDLSYVDASRRDRHGNLLRYSSKVQLSSGAPKHAVDVFFSQVTE